jgi:hypothetical protein
VLAGLSFAAATAPPVAGVLSAYDPARPFATQNKELADLLDNDVAVQLRAQGWVLPNDGVVPDTALGGAPHAAPIDLDHHLELLGPASPGTSVHPSQMPGALVEPLVLSDPAEAAIATSERGQQAIARGVTQGVEQYVEARQA